MATRTRIGTALMICCVPLGLLGGCQRGTAPGGARNAGAAASSAPAPVVPSAAPPPSAAEDALQPDDWFEEVASTRGVEFGYRNGVEGGQWTLLEMVGGGAALVDYDADGGVDILVCGGGTISSQEPVVIQGLPPVLFRQDAEGGFTAVTERAGLAGPTPYSHGCAVADYDEDGFADLLITGYGGSRLYHNDGTGGFRDVTAAAGLPAEGWTIAACWGDVDGDGLADLLQGGYAKWTPGPDQICGDPQRGIPDVCAPHNFPAAASHVHRSAGDGTFSNISRQAGMRDDDRALGIIATDMNDDGRIDFYFANDEAPNRLFLGQSQLPLREIGEESGTALGENGAPEGSMGVDWGDFDGDGRGDLFVTNFEAEDNALYRQQSAGLFRHMTTRSGLAGACRPLVGFGTGFVDFDLDGWLDLFVCNGHVFYSTGQSPYSQPAFLFRNRDGRRFEDRSSVTGPYFRRPHVGRGAAAGDLDGDGAVDLVVVHQNEPVAVLRNRRAPSSWISLRLVGRTASRDATGAVVTCEYGGHRLVRWVRNGAGYLSSFDPRIVLPADAEGPGRVVVRWIGGRTEVFDGLPLGRTSVLVEGRGRE